MTRLQPKKHGDASSLFWRKLGQPAADIRLLLAPTDIRSKTVDARCREAKRSSGRHPMSPIGTKADMPEDSPDVRFQE